MSSSKRVLRSGIRRETLAKWYRVDQRVFQEWLSDIGIEHQKTLKPIELCRMVKELGLPSKDIEVDIPFIRVSLLEQQTIDFNAH